MNRAELKAAVEAEIAPFLNTLATPAIQRDIVAAATRKVHSLAFEAGIAAPEGARFTVELDDDGEATLLPNGSMSALLDQLSAVGAPIRTRAEIDNLVLSWRADQTWDLEDAVGFERHREELKAWRLRHLAQREAEAKRTHETAVEKLMAPAVKYLQALDDDILAGKRGALTTAEVIRALGDVLLPIVERMEYLDNRQDEERRKLEDHVDQQVRRLDGRG